MTSAISRFSTCPRLRVVRRVAVASHPSEVWDVLRGKDTYALELARALAAAHLLPGFVSADLPTAGRPTKMGLDPFVSPGGPFQWLAELPGSELVAGAIGQFWKSDIRFPDVPIESFAPFDSPGFVKVVWAIQVHPRQPGGSWIGMDVRLEATSDDAWHEFTTRCHVTERMVQAVFRDLNGMLVQRFGHPPTDDERRLPGDDLLPSARVTVTEAITIESPVGQVWPWLVRLSRTRAAANHDRGLAALRINPPHEIILTSPSLLPQASPPRPRSGLFRADYDTTWTFALEPIGDVATRLFVRVRADVRPGLRMHVVRPILTIHGVMEHARLEDLKRRVEGSAA